MKFQESDKKQQRQQGKSSKIFYRKILSLITIHLFCLGLIQSPKIKNFTKETKANVFLICINTFLCISSIIHVLSYIVLEPWDNIYNKMEPIQLFCHFFHDIFLYMFLMKNRPKILKLLQEIYQNFRNYEGVILRKKFTDDESISNRILFAIFTVLMAISAAFITHISAKLKEASFLFPVSTKLFCKCDEIENSYFFYGIQVYQFFFGIFSCLLNSAGVVLTITLFMILGSQYEILQICFENLSEPKMCRILSSVNKLEEEENAFLSPVESNDDIYSNEDNTFMIFEDGNNYKDQLHKEYILEQNLKICIKYHLYLKELVADVQTILNSIIFVLFAVCEFMLCLCSFQIFQIYKELSLLQLAKCFSMLVAVLFYEFTSFWYAQQLTIKTEKLFSSIYFSQWYNGSKSYKSCIKIILQNTQKPFILNAGMIVPVTLASFVRSLQAAFSYFNLLRALTESKS